MRVRVQAVLESLGMPVTAAKDATDVSHYADMQGIDSHGVSNMLPVYIDRLREGDIKPDPTMKCTHDCADTRSQYCVRDWLQLRSRLCSRILCASSSLKESHWYLNDY